MKKSRLSAFISETLSLLVLRVMALLTERESGSYLEQRKREILGTIESLKGQIEAWQPTDNE
jgi:hypothetical protein